MPSAMVGGMIEGSVPTGGNWSRATTAVAVATVRLSRPAGKAPARQDPGAGREDSGRP